MARNQMKLPDAPARALRVKEAAIAYRVCRSTIYSLIKSGELPSVKVRGTRLIPVEAMERLLAGAAPVLGPDVQA
jgi:excisionase family DNA binding protein